MSMIVINNTSYKDINLSPYPKDPFYRRILIKTISNGTTITNENLHEVIYCMGIGTSSNNYFPKQSPDQRKVDNTNHDSTHGVRQILYVNHLISLLEPVHRKLINDRDILIMKISVFFRSMGRVHEQKWDIKTNNNIGSAEMFGKFIEGAIVNDKQITEDEIKHYQALIENTCSTVWKDKIEKGSKTELQWHLMTLIHELDLFRCWRKDRIYDAIFRNHNEYFVDNVNLKFQMDSPMYYPIRLEKIFNAIFTAQEQIDDFIPKKRPDLMYLKLKLK